MESRARQIVAQCDAARAALARGDLESATTACEDALTLDPDDPEASQLLVEIRQEKERHPRAASEPASPGAPPRSTQSIRATGSSSRKVVIVAAAAALVLSIGGVVVWMNRPNEALSGPGASASGRSHSVPPTGNANAPVPIRVDPNATAPQGEAARSPSNPPVTSAPAAASPTVGDSLSTQLARISQLTQKGNVAAALAELDRIGPSDDRRVTALARSVAQEAARSMDAALATAKSLKAAELAPVPYAAAEQARSTADAAANRGDYVHAGRQALAATEAYRRAESEARVAAATAAAARTKPGAPQAAASSSVPATPSPTPEAPVPPRTETPTAAAPSPPPVAIAGAGTLAGERPGIERALERYTKAYSARNLTALSAVYPSLPRETRQRLATQFRDCRAYDVSFGTNMTVALAENDPTAATVTGPTTYLCQPAPTITVPPDSRTAREVFSLRKEAGEWVIVSIADTTR